VTSVLITVFEQVRTLTALLECLERQVCAFPWEVLVTDDGSTSDVFDVVQQAAARGRIDIRYVWQPNRGFRASVARNNAIKIARGSILVFLDGDMLVAPDFVFQHTALHSGQSLLICGTRRASIVEDDSDLGDLYRDRRLTLLEDRETMLQRDWTHSETSWMALLSSNFSVSRGPEVAFDENFLGWGFEDREFAYRLVHMHGYQIQLSAAVEAVHICSLSGTNYWHPLNNRLCQQEAFVNLVRNMLYFRDLYPDADLAPALDLLRRYHIDPLTDNWYFDPRHLEPSLANMIEAARSWIARHGIALPSTSQTRCASSKLDRLAPGDLIC
jgi:glycosyltransferase involved in cell wall biosynthesis